MNATNIEIGAVIREHRKRLGLTLEEMQKRTGINNGNLSKIERGQQSLTNDTMKLIAKALGISLSDLFTPHKEHGVASGSAQKTAVPLISDYQTQDDLPADGFVAVGTIQATIDAVRGGVKLNIDSRHTHVFPGDEFKKMGLSALDAIGAYKVEDDAMESRLFKGDIVVVDMGSTNVPQTGGVFCLIMDDGSIAFRRLFPYPGHGLRIVCDNTKYPETVLDHRQSALVQIVGRVKMVRSTSGL